MNDRQVLRKGGTVLKKKLILILSAILLLSLCGCGEKKNDTAADNTSADGTASVQTAESSEEPLIIESGQDSSEYEFTLDNSKPYDSVDEYLRSDSARAALEKLEGPDEQGVIITRIYAEKGTCLVFERRISKDLNMRLEEDFKANIAKTVDSDKETFSSLVDGLEACINRKNITIAVRYLDPDGNLLYESVFDNDDISNGQLRASQEASRAQQSAAKQSSSQQSSSQQSKTSA